MGILSSLFSGANTARPRHLANTARPAESVTQISDLTIAGDVQNAYLENPWVYAAIKAIGTNISGVPFKIRKLTKDGKPGKEITDPRNPWVSLFSDPNP